MVVILKEAEVQQMGIRVGEVGARIVTDVFFGLLEGYQLIIPFSKSFLETNTALLRTIPQQQAFYHC